MKQEGQLLAHVVLLREFMAAREVRFGAPQNLRSFVEHLLSDSSFYEDMCLMLRTILYLEGLALTRPELLRIVTVGVGGLHAVDKASEIQGSIIPLLALIEEVFLRLEEPSSGGSDKTQENIIDSFAACKEVAAAKQYERSGQEDPQLRSVWTSQVDSLSPNFQKSPFLSRQALLAMCIIFLVLGAACLSHPAHVPVAHASSQDARVQTSGLRLTAAANPSQPYVFGQAIRAGKFPQTMFKQQTSVADYPHDLPPKTQIFSATSRSAGPVRSPDSFRSSDLSQRTQKISQTRPDTNVSSPQSVRLGEPEAKQMHFIPVPSPSSSIVSSGTARGKILYCPLPQYPTLAILTHVEGDVVLQVEVGKDGTVLTTHVVRGNPLLRSAAEAAVRRWRYRPPAKSDDSESTIEVRLSFDL